MRVRIVVDEDVRKYYSVREPALIEFYIVTYLNDPNGWGIFFEPVKTGEDVVIHLSMPDRIQKVCGFAHLSCAELGGRIVYLNAYRWFYGAPKSKLSLEDYRQYMVSHEIGHILGYDHKKCPCKGCKAPIMMQQTLSIGQCKPNTIIYDY